MKGKLHICHLLVKGENSEAKQNLNSVEIEKVYETKFLWVIIKDKVCWKPNIKPVKQKLSKSIYVLYQTRGPLNKNYLHLLFFSIVLPYMTYCCEMWGNAYKINPDPIFKLQERATRVINEFGYPHILKLQNIVHSKVVC